MKSFLMLCFLLVSATTFTQAKNYPQIPQLFSPIVYAYVGTVNDFKPETPYGFVEIHVVRDSQYNFCEHTTVIIRLWEQVLNPWRPGHPPTTTWQWVWTSVYVEILPGKDIGFAYYTLQEGEACDNSQYTVGDLEPCN